MSLRLHTIICSTRPGRKGAAIGAWFQDIARGADGFDAHLVDLAEFDLPVFDEPRHPRLKDYQHDHTRRWSASVEAADAFVLIAPEYNFGPTPALSNALNYLFQEWRYKPAGFVSYGGVSAGLRGVQMTKLTLTTLGVMPIPQAVAIPNFAGQIEGDVFRGTDQQADGARTMLAELHRWAAALAPMRKAG